MSHFLVLGSKLENGLEIFFFFLVSGTHRKLRTFILNFKTRKGNYENENVFHIINTENNLLRISQIFVYQIFVFL